MTNKYFPLNAYAEKYLIKLMNEAINCINNEKDNTGNYKYDGTIITKADKLVDNIIKNYLKDNCALIYLLSVKKDYIKIMILLKIYTG